MDVPEPVELRDATEDITRLDRDAEVRQLIDAERRLTELRHRLACATGLLTLVSGTRTWVGICETVGADAVLLRAASGRCLVLLDAVDAVRGLPCQALAGTADAFWASNGLLLQQWVDHVIGLEYRTGGSITGRLTAVYSDHVDISANGIVAVPMSRVAAIHCA